MPFDQYVHITFPNGAIYFVRMADSGIVLDQDEAPIDLELASDMLSIKAWKLGHLPVGGRCRNSQAEKRCCMDLSEIDVDEVAFEQGAWIDNIPNFGDVRLRVRGIFNADWRRLNAKLTAAVPSSKKVGGQLEPEEQDRIAIALLSETCLLGWDGLTDKGVPVVYSRETALKLITERRRFRDAVAWAANVVGQQSVVAKDANQGNSGSGSSGT